MLLKSFLNRKQYVYSNGCQSGLNQINCGVAQGSKLGPLLFLLYINDLPNSINCTPRLFADDTCLIVSNNTVNSLLHSMNLHLSNLHNWCAANKLIINPSKSSCLIIPPNSKSLALDSKLTLSLNNTRIEIVDECKYLGVTLDTKLNFHPHIKSIEHKLSRATGIISKLRSTLPKKALTHLYYAFVHPQLLYGLPVWGSTYKTYLSKLCVLQNKAIKSICGAKYFDKSSIYYSQLNILKLPDLFKFETAKLVHQYFSNHLPSPLSNLFIKNSQISSRTTRSSCREKMTLYTPLYSSSKLQRCIKYQGVKIWNSIPQNYKHLNFYAFKKKFKKFLSENYM